MEEAAPAAMGGDGHWPAVLDLVWWQGGGGGGDGSGNGGVDDGGGGGSDGGGGCGAGGGGNAVARPRCQDGLIAVGGVRSSTCTEGLRPARSRLGQVFDLHKKEKKATCFGLRFFSHWALC